MSGWISELRRFSHRNLTLRIYYILSAPIAIFFILNSRTIHPSYRLGFLKKMTLGARMFWNTVRISTGTSYKTHLAMSLKILETPPSVPGSILECGTWKGGSAANLSLICDLTGRTLKIYDSFEGLPKANDLDRLSQYYSEGDYSGSLGEVRRNLERFGAVNRCEFIQGWFDDTLPALDEPVLLAFIDVDLEASLDTCVRYIWPHLVDDGFIFIDEAADTDYCALFYSERWWSENFDRHPPGLIGAGTGLALGEYYIGPWNQSADHPMQHHNAGAYTCKSHSGHWTYYRD
ncbi:TylF/MycF/NovP-related O-methyltransferase [Mycobacterium sp. RTGN5]|uniref:TylF/MycF/NovP-related O-methyltransferase n=1 Tax=Mycobacterium sp. RTGN5 TaxID=3016522 RepID=UPI0029C69BE8|nr:TylF/MycF/NovP-related O-methyltransferase [Mycobacterium sp. RTGN5]